MGMAGGFCLKGSKERIRLRLGDTESGFWVLSAGKSGGQPAFCFKQGKKASKFLTDLWDFREAGNQMAGWVPADSIGGGGSKRGGEPKFRAPEDLISGCLHGGRATAAAQQTGGDQHARKRVGRLRD